MNPITSLSGLATKVFEFINTRAARKYIDEIKDIQYDLLEEKEKGDESDDGYIEYLYKRLGIVTEAAQSELARLIASR